MSDRLGALYGALATGCGYSFRTIDGMTLAEAGDIFAYWADNPPPHLLLQVIARALGWRPVEAAPAASLADVPPPGLVLAPAAADTPAPVFDPDELRRRNRTRAAAIARRNAARG